MVSCATDAIHSLNSSNAQFQTFTHASNILLQSISSLIKLSPSSLNRCSFISITVSVQFSVGSQAGAAGGSKRIIQV